MNEWIAAAIALGVGLVLATVVSRVTRRTLITARGGRLEQLAAPVASLVFSLLLVATLVTALGIVNPDSLEEIPDDLVAYLPRFLAAVIVMVGGNIVSGLASTAVSRAAAGSGAERSAPAVVRYAILAATLILAADQLGVDTTIITLAAAALLFGVAAAGAMLIGLGGREVAAEIAAGRAWRQVLTPGDEVTIGEHTGRIVELHSAAVELQVGDDRVFIPHRRLLERGVTGAAVGEPDPDA
ncbi:MAG: hypothetical protein AAGA99_15050 [Actinomycetota bacterium]